MVMHACFGQRPRKHFESGGALTKIKRFSNDFMTFTSQTKMFENMESL
jgi:hypothetical protein